MNGRFKDAFIADIHRQYGKNHVNLWELLNCHSLAFFVLLEKGCNWQQTKECLQNNT